MIPVEPQELPFLLTQFQSDNAPNAPLPFYLQLGACMYAIGKMCGHGHVGDNPLWLKTRANWDAKDRQDWYTRLANSEALHDAPDYDHRHESTQENIVSFVAGLLDAKIKYNGRHTNEGIAAALRNEGHNHIMSIHVQEAKKRVKNAA
jgi:hypothetical protein